MTDGLELDPTIRAALESEPTFCDVLVDVTAYGHLIERATVGPCAWLHVDGVSLGDASRYPIKAEGGQWAWNEIKRVRKHVEPEPETTLLRLSGPMPKDWIPIRNHDNGASGVLARASDLSPAMADVALRGLARAGWTLVKLNSNTED
jgi:hypothetical protein